MPTPSPIFFLAMTTMTIVAVLIGSQLYRLRGVKTNKLKEFAENPPSEYKG